MREACLLDRFQPVIRQIIETTINSSAVIDRDDLAQEACLAAIRAARQHDASCGASFRSYIITAIRRAVHRAASQFRGPYTLNSGVLSKASKIYKLALADINVHEISRRMGIPAIDILYLLYLYRGEQMLLTEEILV